MTGMQHVPGEDRGKVILYALSTCGWCADTKKFLTGLRVEFSYVYVDLLTGAERDRVVREVERWNPRLSFPTLVVNDAKAIVGFQEQEIREAVGA
ncbi:MULTISPECIES: glutaredoxin family protein [unclassified Methanoculleus]|uniref:glutaredoxin family protein n=1 Tax=unclassified Methanoculleus TaxID=2619537 RepID=UPI0032AED5D3